VDEGIDRDRRRFLGKVAMTMAAAQLGMFGPPSPLRGFGETGMAEANDREPPELAAIARATEWLNVPRLTAASLRGKVVLVDFCTYTCINWLRTLPYVRAWAQKYRQWLVVIGVHTPEFAFEHNVDNVRRAVRQMRIEYPIVIDNDYSIWRAFKNQYWPALYFIDARGEVRDHHFGEGEYERSEKVIQRLLKEAGAAAIGEGAVSVDASGVETAADWDSLNRLRITSATTGPRTSPRPAAATRIDAASMLRLRDWRSINGRSLASGRWAGRQQSSAALTVGSRIAFTRATFISSWARHVRGSLYVSACRSTGSRRVLLTASTTTRAATARSSNRGCISWSDSRNRSSIDSSRSSSSMAAWRRSHSHSADPKRRSIPTSMDSARNKLFDVTRQRCSRGSGVSAGGSFCRITPLPFV
jgi:thiol-disulfide isomerase/thioredoxin